MEVKHKNLLISTKELIKLIIENSPQIIETQLILNGLKATHFTYTKNGKRFYDTGIDTQEYKINKNEFLALYNKANWIINQIV